jgi:hypothetical protein
VGLVLLVTAGGLFVAFAPVYSCHACEVDIAVAKGVSPLKSGPAAPVAHHCSHCNGHGRVTPLTRWLKCVPFHDNYFQFQ